MVLQDVAAYLDAPFAMFGHSLGALVAFELCCELRRRSLSLPSVLIVSGHRAPHLPNFSAPVHNRPDDSLLNLVGRLGMVPEEVRQDEALRQLAVAVLRQDLRLAETYRYSPEAPLACPIVAFGGRHDPRVSPDEIRMWGHQTNSVFTHRILDGGHFYLAERHESFIAEMRRILLRVPGEGAGSPATDKAAAIRRSPWAPQIGGATVPHMQRDDLDTAEVPAAILRVVPPGVRFEGGAPKVASNHLFSSELEIVEGSVRRRRQEFNAGRYYARRALTALGLPASPILATAGRYPVWPDGIVGSISHCTTFCGAAVAFSREILALGLDVEEDGPLFPELVPMICSPAELGAATENIGWPEIRVAKLIFSIKESIFKAYYPRARSFLDFHEVVVILNRRHGEFVGRILPPERSRVIGREQIAGRFGAAAGVVFAIASVPAANT